MPGYYLANTNKTYDSHDATLNYMLNNECVVAYNVAAQQVYAIERSDLVFIYENGIGIIAVGTATGEWYSEEWLDDDGEVVEEVGQPLRDFRMLGEPIAPSEINALAQELSEVGIYYARTIVSLRARLGSALYELAEERANPE